VPHLLRTVSICRIIPGLRTYSLISIGHSCDAGCSVLFLNDTVSIGFKNAVIMQGAQARSMGFWYLDLSQQSPLHGTPPITMSLLLPTNSCKRKVASLNLRPSMPTAAPTALQPHTCLTTVGSTTHQALVAFSHAALFSPALSTLVTALPKGFPPQTPVLALATLCKYPPHSVEAVKGHLGQIHKNLRSTKTMTPPLS
jgi:hypothetical protein